MAGIKIDYASNLLDGTMLLMIGAAVLVLWLLGFILLKKAVGGLIHILLVIALILIVLHFISARGGMTS